MNICDKPFVVVVSAVVDVVVVVVIPSIAFTFSCLRYMLSRMLEMVWQVFMNRMNIMIIFREGFKIKN